MENETPLEGTTPPDFTNLENQISDLVEVIQAEQEIKAEEKALAEEEQAKAEEENAKVEADTENFQTIYTTTSESQTLAIEGLQAEMSAMTAQLGQLTTAFEGMNETMLKQNDLIVEGSFTITLAICIVASIRVFIDQISKW